MLTYPIKGWNNSHDGFIKWKHFPRYWPFVRGIHLWPVNSPRKGQWRGDLVFSLICAWINDWGNSRDAGDLRRHRTHCDVIVRKCLHLTVATYEYDWFYPLRTTLRIHLNLSVTEIVRVLSYKPASIWGYGYVISASQMSWCNYSSIPWIQRRFNSTIVEVS